MKLKCLLFLSPLFLTFANAEENKADCLILEDENSIICKYSHVRISSDKNITIHWIEPDGTTTRTREMTIPAYHASVYDYRYIEGRTKGKWTFKVLDNEDEYTTTFIVK